MSINRLMVLNPYFYILILIQSKKQPATFIVELEVIKI